MEIVDITSFGSGATNWISRAWVGFAIDLDQLCAVFTCVSLRGAEARVAEKFLDRTLALCGTDVRRSSAAARAG